MTQQEKAVEIVERLRRYVGLAKKGKLILGLNFCETSLKFFSFFSATPEAPPQAPYD